MYTSAYINALQQQQSKQDTKVMLDFLHLKPMQGHDVGGTFYLPDEHNKMQNPFQSEFDGTDLMMEDALT